MAQDDFLRYEALGIAALLRTRSLGVPFYQRSYSWRTVEDESRRDSGDDKLQVVDYWNDLINSFYSRVSYFLGTVVLAREGGDGRQLVIDGQQRLATTSLLLAATRDRFNAGHANDFGNSTQQDFLGKFDRRAGADRPKLIMNTDDRDFFDRHVVLQENIVPTNNSQQLLSEAYKYLRQRIDEFTDRHGTDWRDKLNELVDWLDKGAQVVAIDVATEADAFVIFETLNDRGADLTVADLLKNYLFSQAESRLDEVRDSWVATLANLDIDKVGNQLFTTYARHMLSSKYGRTREREVYGRLKSIVEGPAQAVSFAQDLKDSSRIYDAILTADNDFWSDFPVNVSSAAEVLVELNLEQYRPLMLSALTSFPKTEIMKFVPAMVCWVVRGLSAGTLGAGSAEVAFCEAANEIRSGNINKTEQILSASRVGSLIPTDGEFKSIFSAWRVTRGPLARYLLRALELEARGDSEPELVVNPDVEQVNLEHIYPKSAKSEDWPAFSAEDARTYVPRVGNLCLLQKGPNGRIGNKPWIHKRKVLRKSSFLLTSQVDDYSDWTKESIDQRQARLADLAIRTWPRFPR